MDYITFPNQMACWITILLLCYSSLLSTALPYHGATANTKLKPSIPPKWASGFTEIFQNTIRKAHQYKVMETASFRLPPDVKDNQHELNGLPNLVAASTERPLYPKKHRNHNHNHQWHHTNKKQSNVHDNSPYFGLTLRDVKTKPHIKSSFANQQDRSDSTKMPSSPAKGSDFTKLSFKNMVASVKVPDETPLSRQQSVMPHSTKTVSNETRLTKIPVYFNSSSTTVAPVISTSLDFALVPSLVSTETVSEIRFESSSKQTYQRGTLTVTLLTPTAVLGATTTVFNQTLFQENLSKNQSTEQLLTKEELNSSRLPWNSTEHSMLPNVSGSQNTSNSTLLNNKGTPTTDEVINEDDLSFILQPTPSTYPTWVVSRPKVKSKPSQHADPSKLSTQRPPRNIIPLDIKSKDQRPGTKPTLMPSRSGLLHLTEEDSATSHGHKPLITSKIKGFTKNGLNAKILAAVTTEFMRPSEMIPHVLIVPTITQKAHSTMAQHGGKGATLSPPSTVTAALSFRSQDKNLILSATATLNPSRMTHLCTQPCSEGDCKCCQDKQSASVGATGSAVSVESTDSATPHTEVSTHKNPSNQLTLSTGFGIGMGCLIAVWLIVGPVICLVCRIRDKTKKEQEMENKYKSVSPTQENSITEALVMDELNKQFSKMKSNRDTEYLLFAKDKMELVSLSNADSATQTTNQYVTSPTDTATLSRLSKKWADIDDDDEDNDSDEDKEEKLIYAPTVSV